MSIYTFDNEIASEQLTPPVLRTTKFLAWLKVLVNPTGWLWQLIFEDYSDGQLYASWTSPTVYALGARVTWTDKANYECIEGHISNVGLEPSGGIYSATYWVKIQDNFIGANQRVKFNSQIIVLEHALNKWYQVSAISSQIYIGINIAPNVFVMGNSGATSSKMPNDSVFMLDYLGVTPNFAATEFTVYVPAALYATLGTNATNRENNVRRFVDKYKISGITYNVTTY